MARDQPDSNLIRIGKQAHSRWKSVSFDIDGAMVFQQYMSGTLRFQIRRAAVLYGTVDEAGNVRVAVIYEPCQDGTETSLGIKRDTDEQKRADALASLLG
jgi:hypothetical protein